MTYTEQKTYPVGTGDNVTYHDPGNDGHPEKWVNGTVTGVSEEGFNVLWDDFKEKGWETEYEWDKVTFKGEQLIDGEGSMDKSIDVGDVGDVEKAAKNYAIYNYTKAPNQSVEDSEYVQAVSFHSFKAGVEWQSKNG